MRPSLTLLRPLALALGFVACLGPTERGPQVHEGVPLRGPVKIHGELWWPSEFIGRAWCEVSSAGQRVEFWAERDGSFELTGWPLDAMPIRVKGFVGEKREILAEGSSREITWRRGETVVDVGTIKLHESPERAHQRSTGVLWGG